eukprot:1160905-Pelagomonas_calceolata.AAC.13
MALVVPGDSFLWTYSATSFRTYHTDNSLSNIAYDLSTLSAYKGKEKKRNEKLRRQRKLSLHQLRKRRHIGSEEP